MFEAKKRAANFSGYKTGHGVLHVNKAYLNAKQSKTPSHRNGGSGIGGDLSYTEGSKSTSSPLLLNHRRFFTPQLRSIAKAVVQAVTGVWVSARTQPTSAVRDPHLNRWTYQSKTLGVI
jgi:hypothetical protein